VAQASTREHPLLTCDSRSLSKNVPWEMFGLQRRFSKWGLKALRALRLLFSRPPKCKAGHQRTELLMRLSIRIYRLGRGDRTVDALCRAS
jgi:hypothetical protein